MKGKRIWPMVLVALALVGILAGCGCTANDAKPNNGTNGSTNNGTVNTDGDGHVSTGTDSTEEKPVHKDDAITDDNGDGMMDNVVDDTVDGVEDVVDDATDMVDDTARSIGRGMRDMVGGNVTGRDRGRIAN